MVLKYTKVYAYVCADLLHIGHLRCVQQAKSLGDHLTVRVITDEGVASYKRKPIIPFEQRLELGAKLALLAGNRVHDLWPPYSDSRHYAYGLGDQKGVLISSRLC